MDSYNQANPEMGHPSQPRKVKESFLEKDNSLTFKSFNL